MTRPFFQAAGKFPAVLLDIPAFRAYNDGIFGMTKDTFSVFLLAESARAVKAHSKGWRIPPSDRKRPVPDTALMKRSERVRATRVEPRAKETTFHARPFMKNDGTGVFHAHPERTKEETE